MHNLLSAAQDCREARCHWYIDHVYAYIALASENVKHARFTATRWLRAFRHRSTYQGADTIFHSVQKTSWADDVEDLGENFRSLSFHNLIVVQINPKVKIIPMKMAFGQ